MAPNAHTPASHLFDSEGTLSGITGPSQAQTRLSSSPDGNPGRTAVSPVLLVEAARFDGKFEGGSAGLRVQDLYELDSRKTEETKLNHMKTNAVRLLITRAFGMSCASMRLIRSVGGGDGGLAKSGCLRSRCLRLLGARGPKRRLPGSGAGDMELDEKRWRDSRRSKMELAPLKEVQPLTGYVRGGVTALACKREYPVFGDETAELFDAISESAGARRNARSC